MRAATRERMISIMAEAGLAGGLSANRKLSGFYGGITPLKSARSK